MRIGIDFDGTLASWGDAMAAYLDERHGLPLAADRHVQDQLPEDIFVPMVRELMASEWTLAMPPLPGALDAMRLLSAEHELYVVTARHRHEAEWAARWVDHHGLWVQEVVHTDRAPKSAACRRLGLSVLLDDNLPVLAEICGTATVPAHLRPPPEAIPWMPTLDDIPAAIRPIEHWPHFGELCRELCGCERCGAEAAG
ncbi:MAG: hypothetical protein GEU80_03090 [Dehalococcoidia bacterium]|nr:hypothetical protein [Dehalococcoidia bacterium]